MKQWKRYQNHMGNGWMKILYKEVLELDFAQAYSRNWREGPANRWNEAPFSPCED